MSSRVCLYAKGLGPVPAPPRTPPAPGATLAPFFTMAKFRPSALPRAECGGGLSEKLALSELDQKTGTFFWGGFRDPDWEGLWETR